MSCSRLFRSCTSSCSNCRTWSRTSPGTPSGPRNRRSTRSRSASPTLCRWTCRSPAGSFTSSPACSASSGDVYGWDSGQANQGFPYFGEQATGAWLGLGLMLLYAGRGYWREVFQSAWQGARSDDPAEARRYRAAFAGLVVGSLLLGLFAALIGMSRLGRAGLLRHRVPAGLRHHARPGRVRLAARDRLGEPDPGAGDAVRDAGAGGAGSDADVGAVLVQPGLPQPPHAEPAGSLQDAGRQARRAASAALSGVLLFAAVVSLLATDWANLHVTYAAGAEGKAAGYKAWVGQESYGRLASG